MKRYIHNSIWQNSCDHTGSHDQMISSTDLYPTWCSLKSISTIHLKGFQIDRDEMVLSSNQNQNSVLKDQSGIKLMVSIWKPDYCITFIISFLSIYLEWINFGWFHWRDRRQKSFDVRNKFFWYQPSKINQLLAQIPESEF